MTILELATCKTSDVDIPQNSGVDGGTVSGAVIGTLTFLVLVAIAVVILLVLIYHMHKKALEMIHMPCETVII